MAWPWSRWNVSETMSKPDLIGPGFSVVVPTLGRREEVVRLLESLARQTTQSLEVILVDQNDQAILVEALANRNWPFPVLHMRTPGQRGASRARNVGWRRARGSIIVFADDDCWYAPWLLEKCLEIFTATHADLVTGRAADKSGRSINGRFELTPLWVDRSNVWTTSIEWMIFVRRAVLDSVDGFDETIGIGASTPWQSAEGQDLVLRALAVGYRCFFEPSLYGFHPELPIASSDPTVHAKARAYGRGMGYVLKRHGYGWAATTRWIARPLAGAAISAFLGRRSLASYYMNVVLGRWEGWRHSAADPVVNSKFPRQMSIH